MKKRQLLIAFLAFFMAFTVVIPIEKNIKANESEKVEKKVKAGGIGYTIRGTFIDTNMAQAVADKIAGGNLNHVIIQEDINNATNWNSGFNNKSISNIEGIQYFTALQGLSLLDNEVSDITPLSNLTSLTLLTLTKNKISNVTPLSELTNLKILYLNNNNKISDISSLSNLTNLLDFEVGNGQISDISVVANFTKLQVLYLNNNNISDISPLSNLADLVIMSVGDQTITNEVKLVDNNLVLINNNVKDLAGHPITPKSISDNGIYNGTAATISWAGLPIDTNEVSYTFVNENENGNFDGTVIQPLDFTKLELTINSQEEYVLNSNISQEQFLNDINASTNKDATITSDFESAVNLNKIGVYSVTVTATTEHETDSKTMSVLVTNEDTVIHLDNKEMIYATDFEINLKDVSKENFINEASAKAWNTINGSEVAVDVTSTLPSSAGNHEVTFATAKGTAVFVEVKIFESLSLSVNSQQEYVVNSTITKEQFLNDINASANKDATISSNFESVVDLNKVGTYNVTVTATTEDETDSKTVSVLITNDDIIVTECDKPGITCDSNGRIIKRVTKYSNGKTKQVVTMKYQGTTKNYSFYQEDNYSTTGVISLTKKYSSYLGNKYRNSEIIKRGSNKRVTYKQVITRYNNFKTKTTRTYTYYSNGKAKSFVGNNYNTSSYPTLSLSNTYYSNGKAKTVKKYLKYYKKVYRLRNITTYTTKGKKKTYEIVKRTSKAKMSSKVKYYYNKAGKLKTTKRYGKSYRLTYKYNSKGRLTKRSKKNY